MQPSWIQKSLRFGLPVDINGKTYCSGWMIAILFNATEFAKQTFRSFIRKAGGTPLSRLIPLRYAIFIIAPIEFFRFVTNRNKLL